MASMNGSGDDACRPQSPGSKQIKCIKLPTMSAAAGIGPAPVSRIYTKDYSKKQESNDMNDVGPYLGDPLRW